MYIYANTPQIIPIRPLEWRRKGSTIETRERNLTEKKKSGRKMVAETILSVGKKIGKKSGAEEGERFEGAVEMITTVENRRKKSEAEGAKG